jgi:hypothetical protein
VETQSLTSNEAPLSTGQRTVKACAEELNSLQRIIERGINRIETMMSDDDESRLTEDDGSRVQSRPMSEIEVGYKSKTEVNDMNGEDDAESPERSSSLKSTRRKSLSLSVRTLLGNGGDDVKPRDAGFVTFTNLFTTHAALQMIHRHTPFEMEAVEAPNPHDIFWPNIGRSHRELQVGKFLGFILTAFVCLFWTLPVALATSISNVDALKDLLPFLKPILDAFPILELILAQIAPLFVYLLNELLPMILTKFAKMEGPISSSVLETSLFVKYASFMVCLKVAPHTYSQYTSHKILSCFVDYPDVLCICHFWKYFSRTQRDS